ncbi:Endonuclease/exonuclease/phosphatase [Trametes polyzona]|nr:Endonuclease/exonuclease/phosphatase [Trametes polyzona]
MTASLHVVFQNVNHSPPATHMLLDRCAAQGVDIVCIQEPWYGPIRPIPSASPAGPADRTDDNRLYGTQLHPAWKLVETRKDARVACHVSRRLVNAVVSLDASVAHRDCTLLLVRLAEEQAPIAILNIYNDRANSAVEYLADIVHSLPPIDIAGGDYNTHASVWDSKYPEDSAARVGEVLDLHARLGLRLLSPPDPAHTVLDLVWVPVDRPPELYSVRVALDGRGLSDHAVIYTTIPARDWSLEGPPNIAPKSAAESAFLSDIRAAVHARLPPGVDVSSEAGLRAVVDTLFDCIRDAWAAHAKPVVICDKSRIWWDRSCTEARDCLEEARERLARASVRRAFRRLKSAMRARRNQHFEERIHHVAERQRRVWDLMSGRIHLARGG